MVNHAAKPKQPAAPRGRRAPVLLVVGYSKSGKTTLIEKLIQALGARGLRVAAIKHVPHHPEALTDTPGTDSWRYSRSGASVSGLVTSQGMAFFWPAAPGVVPGGAETVSASVPAGEALPERISAEEGTRLRDAAAAVGGRCDLILAEGFKSVEGPRIEVVGGDQASGDLTSEDLISQVERDLLAIVSERRPAGTVATPVFRPDEIDGLAQRIVEALGLA